MSDIIDSAKRIKAFDKIFVWKSGNKVTIKDLDVPNEHFTMLVTPEGILDFHTTFENGSDKEYESLGKIDIKKMGESFQNDPNAINNLLMSLAQSLLEVDFTEDEFKNYKVVKMQTKEDLSNVAQKQKRVLVIPSDSLYDVSNIPWSDAKNNINDTAIIYDENDKMIGSLYHKGGKYFFLKHDFFESSWLANLISNALIDDHK